MIPRPIPWIASGPAGGLVLRLGEIFYFIVLPMLLLIGIGFLLQRRLGLDMPTLTRLNFYFVIPGMVYGAILTSNLGSAEVGVVIGFGVLMVIAVGLVTLVLARIRGVRGRLRNALLMTTIFNNSGNYGLPLQALAFRGAGVGATAVSIQVFTMIVQNIGNFTLGVFLAAGGRSDRRRREILLQILKFPPLYALAAAAATLLARRWLGGHAPAAAAALRPFWDVVLYVKDAFVAVALCTLGAQLALVRGAGEGGPVGLSIFVRLLLSPLLALCLILLLGIHGMLAQVLLIGSATPAPVNAALLSLEFENHPDYVARAVLYTTLLSPLTVTLVVMIAQGGYLAPLVS